MESIWDDEIIPALTDYIRIPNKSPAFRSRLGQNRPYGKAVALFEAWAQKSSKALPRRSRLEVVRLKGARR